MKPVGRVQPLSLASRCALLIMGRNLGIVDLSAAGTSATCFRVFVCRESFASCFNLDLYQRMILREKK